MFARRREPRLREGGAPARRAEARRGRRRGRRQERPTIEEGGFNPGTRRARSASPRCALPRQGGAAAPRRAATDGGTRRGEAKARAMERRHPNVNGEFLDEVDAEEMKHGRRFPGAAERTCARRSRDGARGQLVRSAAGKDGVSVPLPLRRRGGRLRPRRDGDPAHRRPRGSHPGRGLDHAPRRGRTTRTNSASTPARRRSATYASRTAQPPTWWSYPDSGKVAASALDPERPGGFRVRAIFKETSAVTTPITTARTT